MKTKTLKTINQMLQLAQDKQNEVAKICSQKTTSIGRIQFPVPQEVIEKAVTETTQHYDETIATVRGNLESEIATAEKTAIQGYYAAIPQPTQAHREIAADLVSSYNHDKNLPDAKAAQFMEQLQFHLENETVQAHAYILAYKELFPDVEIPMDWYRNIAPDITEQQLKLDEITESKNLLEALDLYAQLESNPDVITSISAKRRLHELGENPNAPDAFFEKIGATSL